jgi:diadenosine tetraphosphate (Ap4A) HIT family hydrolase
LTGAERVDDREARAGERAGTCDFCAVAPDEVLVENDLALGIRASYPVSPGHALIVPRRHEPDFFSLRDDEQAAVWRLIGPIRRRIDEELRPDGYNLGLNNGRAAGQTIMHAHLHVIPRYAGDVEDPRGGVRWVLPKTARYW